MSRTNAELGSISDEDLGACGSCLHYDPCRAHTSSPDGIRIHCRAYEARQQNQATTKIVAASEDCVLYNKDLLHR